MKSHRFYFAVSAIFMLASGLVLCANADPRIDLISATVIAIDSNGASSADPAIKMAASNLRRVETGVQAGVNSISDLSNARISLADAQAKSTYLPFDPATVQQALATIVSERRQLLVLATQQFKAGTSSRQDLIKAQTALAIAGSRQCLFMVVCLRQQTFAFTQQSCQTGQATTRDLTSAQVALQEAQQLFVKSGEVLE